MKKLFSIAIALVMLLSGLQLTVSTHYCGGELADSKVSVLGDVASCGMDTATEQCTNAAAVTKTSCCDNQVSVYEVDHNYSSSFTGFKAFAQTVLQAFIIPETIAFHSMTAENQIITDISPPGNLLANAVSLPKICVFRI